jgi:dissimilatory sulfite reductase related protein
MSVETLAGVTVEVNEEGFLLVPAQWTEAMAVDLARREGIESLSERQWEVIRTMRAEFEKSGSGPNVRALAKISGVPIKELYLIFPKGPAKLAAKIAGIPKPKGCI